ncbi:hypothetical protein NFC81_01595 [Salinispirillum sp. LH 10-3-1]|uniref:Uncharacterized protein n=1 Tax=Salinispirillum sp. LH 10-3-1 TaxID=2952525 RepID=A0AB38YGJ7_9GAMM
MPQAIVTSPLRHSLAGLLLVIGLLLQIISFIPAFSLTDLASYVLWSSVVLLWVDIPRRTRWQAGILAVVGLGLTVSAAVGYEAEVDWARVLTGNVYVVAMLLGVSFIGLIGSEGANNRATLGRTGFIGMLQTWAGVHFLGIVLNLSTMFLVGDRLARQGELKTPQLLAINRGLSSAALWSPFFASMAVVMTLVPDMAYQQILLWGFPLAMLAGLISSLDLRQRFDLSDVTGFSLTTRSLLMPLIMAAWVLLFHWVITPSLSIVSIITLLMPLAALMSRLWWSARSGVRQLKQHVLVRMPLMRGEVSLFLAAGLLTIGLSTFIEAFMGAEWTLFAQFGVLQAISCLTIIVVTATLGLHPIIGISVLASMLSLQGSEQTLFAFTALGGWAIGTSVGPLSGINLSLQGRYGVSGYQIMRQNIPYALAMFGLMVLALAGLARVLA